MAGPGSADNDLSQQLERLEAKLNEMEAANSRAKAVARLMTLLIAVTAVSMVIVVIYPLYKAGTTDRETYVKTITKDAEARLRPVIEREAKDFANEVVPAYRDAVQRTYASRTPEIIGKLDSEAQTLWTNVRNDMQQQLTVFQQKVVEEQYARLAEELPELRDRENAELVMGRMAEVSQNVATRIVNDLFAEQFGALMQLEETYNKFAVPRDISNLTNDMLNDHVLNLVTELVSVKFNADKELKVEGLK
ncbi:hypothetical protein HZA57_04135 [Candidatus Poribacteria bacterium]|nr:hypothetical protein [Candidatus Poribacteria bacterium]